MKKLFTLILVQCMMVTAWAQFTDLPANFDQERTVGMESIQQVKLSNDPFDRSTTEQFIIDYDLIDFNYANDNYFLYSGFVWELNRSFQQADAFTLRWSAVAFDTIITDQGVGIPRSEATITVDSLGVLMGHINNSGNTDMVIVTMSSLNFGVPANPTFLTNVVWADTIMTDSSLSDGVTAGGLPNIFEAVFTPNITLNQGQAFAVRVDFVGDTATSEFYVVHDFRDDCDDLCGASPSIVGVNTYSWGNWGSFSGVNAVSFNTANCDSLSGATCNQWFLQNMTIRSWVTAEIEFNAVVNASATEGCAGEVLTLDVSATGGQLPLTYSWVPTTGLSDPNSSSPQAVVGASDVTYVVTVIDGSNDTVTASVAINSNDIQVSVANQDLSCGGSVSLTAMPTGETFNTTYAWSNGGSSFVTNVNTAGTYTVTVTNNAGCTASDAAAVTLVGVGQTLGLAVPPTICEDETVIFDNTSSIQNNWLFTWYFGDGDSLVGTDATHAYVSPGNYTVTLSADSANCSLAASSSATVLAASNSLCFSGIEPLPFEANITISPSPASNHLNLKIGEAGSSNLELKIYDLNGHQLYANSYENVNGLETQIDVSKMESGIYYIKLETQGRVTMKKFAVAR